MYCIATNTTNTAIPAGQMYSGYIVGIVVKRGLVWLWYTLGLGCRAAVHTICMLCMHMSHVHVHAHAHAHVHVHVTCACAYVVHTPEYIGLQLTYLTILRSSRTETTTSDPRSRRYSTHCRIVDLPPPPPPRRLLGLVLPPCASCERSNGRTHVTSGTPTARCAAAGNVAAASPESVARSTRSTSSTRAAAGRGSSKEASAST
jgi:hypothetical protein